MTLPRIFVALDLVLGQQVVLDAAAYKHAVQVLRLKLGDQLIVFNGRGGEFIASIAALDKKQAVIFLAKFIEQGRESSLKIHLGQGISRGEKMDFTIQKSVELGVYAITPIFTERCNVRLEEARLEKRQEHWQRVAVSAAEQSGRCLVPVVYPARSFDAWVAEAPGIRILMDPEATTSISDLPVQPETVSILIGSEGGLSAAEIASAKEKNFFSTRLGPRVLRTETAALTIISILQSKWGDLR